MQDGSRTWLGCLKSHAKKCRAGAPIPVDIFFSRAQKLQLTIIKGALFNLLNSHAFREQLEESKKKQARNCIIFTSNGTGLMAASKIMRQGDLVVFPLYPPELRDFLQLYPDPHYNHHVHIWSHFMENLDAHQTSLLAESYPLRDGEKYWLHVEGIICGPKLARGSEHLWSWDGNHPRLLKKNFRAWAA